MYLQYIFIILLYFLQVCAVYICYGAETVSSTCDLNTYITLTTDNRFCNLSLFFVFLYFLFSPFLSVVSLYVTAHNELVIASCHRCGTVKCYCTHHVNNTRGNNFFLTVTLEFSVFVIRLVYLTNRELCI